MRMKHVTGGCSCCECLQYINYFPSWPVAGSINWDDDYSDDEIGDPTYSYTSDFTLPASHFMIDLRSFVPPGWFKNKSWPAGNPSEDFVNVRLLDPSDDSIVFDLEIYADDFGWVYTESLGITSAYHLTGIVVSENTSLQSEEVLISIHRRFAGSTSLTDTELADWKSDFETADWEYQATSTMPLIEVRETHVTVVGPLAAMYKKSDIDMTGSNAWIKSTFDNRYNMGVPLYTGAIAASKLQVAIEDGSGNGEEGRLVVVQGLKDTIGSSNALCPERNCRYIDDYHAQRWDLENLSGTVTGASLVFDNTSADAANGSPSINQRSLTACNETRTVATFQELLEPEYISIRGADVGFPYTDTGTGKMTFGGSVQVLGDEFSDATITTGKVKIRVTVVFNYEAPLSLPVNEGDRLAFSMNVSKQQGYPFQYLETGFVYWEFEEDRWSGNSRPSIGPLSGSTATAMEERYIWIMTDVDVGSTATVYTLDYTTTKIDLETLSISL